MLVYPIHGNNPKSKPQLPDPFPAGSAIRLRIVFPNLCRCRALELHQWRTEITRSYWVRFTNGMKRTSTVTLHNAKETSDHGEHRRK
jgi:hypothetical protein